jgi:hypothetical protein
MNLEQFPNTFFGKSPRPLKVQSWSLGKCAQADADPSKKTRGIAMPDLTGLFLMLGLPSPRLRPRPKLKLRSMPGQAQAQAQESLQ